MTYTTGPVLALVPGTRTAPGTGANTGPRVHPELTDERLFAESHYAGYHAWLNHVWHAAACSRPVRMRGDLRHIDEARALMDEALTGAFTGAPASSRK